MIDSESRVSEMDNTLVLKKCTKCNEEKPITEFHKHIHHNDGYRTHCKKCCSLYSKNVDDDVKKKRLAYAKAWNAANKERYAANNKAWLEANKERKSATNKAWYKANPERIATKERNRRSRQRNAPGQHTVMDISDLFKLQKSKCAVCNKSIKKGYHVDHVVALVNGGSNDKCNLQLLCAKCNLSKSDKDPIEFMQQIGFLL